MYLGVPVSSMTWRHHIERTAAKTLGRYKKTYSTFETVRLITNIQVALCKALVRSVMAYEWSIWEYAADAHVLKL
jgi:hypothetical protein